MSRQKQIRPTNRELRLKAIMDDRAKVTPERRVRANIVKLGEATAKRIINKQGETKRTARDLIEEDHRIGVAGKSIDTEAERAVDLGPTMLPEATHWPGGSEALGYAICCVEAALELYPERAMPLYGELCESWNSLAGEKLRQLIAEELLNTKSILSSVRAHIDDTIATPHLPSKPLDIRDLLRELAGSIPAKYQQHIADNDPVVRATDFVFTIFQRTRLSDLANELGVERGDELTRKIEASYLPIWAVLFRSLRDAAGLRLAQMDRELRKRAKERLGVDLQGLLENDPTTRREREWLRRLRKRLNHAGVLRISNAEMRGRARRWCKARVDPGKGADAASEMRMDEYQLSRDIEPVDPVMAYDRKNRRFI